MLVRIKRSEGRCKGETGELEGGRNATTTRKNRLEVNRARGRSRVTSALAATLYSQK